MTISFDIEIRERERQRGSEAAYSPLLWELTMHGADALKALEVPEFDGHVGGAGCQQLASVVEGDVLHRICVSLQCPLKIPRLIVPHLGERGELALQPNIALHSEHTKFTHRTRRREAGSYRTETHTHLYGGVLGGRHHDAEDGVEDDACDRAAVATQGVLLWGAGDPLLRVPPLPDGAPRSDLLFSFI